MKRKDRKEKKKNEGLGAECDKPWNKFWKKIHGKDLRDPISEENEERVQKSQEWKEKGRGIAKIDLIHTFLPDQGCSVILIVEIDRSDKSNRFLFDNLRLRSEMRRASFPERGIIRIF
ncbi:hypothetical protein HZH66_012268 [Vespula vulgaris]|uniref:Uncharacterized protein n=1 Tax=Vespula vulgaris TaxID=7454 RepID=A0A834JDJ9_VESVU|nr:hypothetical protein HZH66_012268 [Vespula vulgaris]